MITSSQNAKLKLARSLMGRPRERHAAGAFVAEGVRLVEEALSAGWPIRFVLYTEGLSGRGLELVTKLETRSVEVEQVSEALLNSLSEQWPGNFIAEHLQFSTFGDKAYMR